MKKFYEILVMSVAIVFFLIVIVGILLFVFISSNNITQEYKCEKMNEYGYLTTLEEYRFVLTCYIIMDDGTKIRSEDYVISDNREPRIK